MDNFFILLNTSFTLWLFWIKLVTICVCWLKTETKLLRRWISMTRIIILVFARGSLFHTRKNLFSWSIYWKFPPHLNFERENESLYLYFFAHVIREWQASMKNKWLMIGKYKTFTGSSLYSCFALSFSRTLRKFDHLLFFARKVPSAFTPRGEESLRFKKILLKM